MLPFPQLHELGFPSLYHDDSPTTQSSTIKFSWCHSTKSCPATTRAEVFEGATETTTPCQCLQAGTVTEGDEDKLPPRVRLWVDQAFLVSFTIELTLPDAGLLLIDLLYRTTASRRRISAR